MRLVFGVLMIFLSVNFSLAADLHSSREAVKKSIPAWNGAMENSLGEKLTGGEDMNDPSPITSLPFSDTGNTCGFNDDYDEACPFGGSASADVVYAFTPGSDLEISVDLCAHNETSYDTKVYIYAAGASLLACNDDYYEAGECGDNTSYLGSVELSAGMTYYIVVDGSGNDCGPYFLEVAEVVPDPPCEIVSTDPDDEGEPALVNGYVDSYNSGCNATPVALFHELLGDAESGELEFLGKSGLYTNDDTDLRDTDWFTAVFNDAGQISWEVTAEQRMTMYRLSEGDCDNLTVMAQATVVPCTPQTLVLNGSPGDVAWLWLGPESYNIPSGFSGNDFNYVLRFEGLFGVPVEQSTWGDVKAMYR